MLKILVMGAGAIGCLVGGYLAIGGHQVTLVGRSPLMERIAANGLTLQHPGRPIQTAYPETATTVPVPAAPFDFIILTVKSPATREAIAQLAPLMQSSTFLVSLQNGIGNEEQLAAEFGPEKVIAGTITIPVRMPELGFAKATKKSGGLGLAPLHPAQPVPALAGALNQAGLRTPVYSNYQAMKWSKLLLNIVVNASSAILNQSPGQIVARRDLIDLEIEAMRETIAVMQAQGIPAVNLPGYAVAWLVRGVCAGWLPAFLKRILLRPHMVEGRGEKMPSLQLDLAAGRPVSEIEALNGAVVRSGQKYGLNTPVNRVLTDLTNGLFSGEIARSTYERQPQKLIQAVAAARSQQAS